ncbi:hypothetical protein HPB52_018737 [Rhipicephalus sanguineus]|uniref:Uncharacterized protein n=1 Tax=Rhipicephalus sanguineus TaxID=34632 RepID=A0A9D4T5X0_RHISA|nr:hypothetical protein HPB52_018737 [Rhipicephalus sanguineus]
MNKKINKGDFLSSLQVQHMRLLNGAMCRRLTLLPLFFRCRSAVIDSSAAMSVQLRIPGKRAGLATTAAILTHFIVRREVFATGACSPVPQSSDIGDRATCPFTVTVDTNRERIPAELPMMKCNCPDSLCSTAGDYRCQESSRR